MNKAELTLLEKLFEREVEAALNKWPSHLLQTRSKVAAKLAEDGYLQTRRIQLPGDRLGPIVVEGYELTHFGRLTYCATCSDEPDERAASAQQGETT